MKNAVSLVSGVMSPRSARGKSARDAGFAGVSALVSVLFSGGFFDSFLGLPVVSSLFMFVLATANRHLRNGVCSADALSRGAGT